MKKKKGKKIEKDLKIEKELKSEKEKNGEGRNQGTQQDRERKFKKEITEKKIGNNIRKLREKAKLTQEQVAARLQTNGCDITRSAVAKIEVGQRHLYPDEIIL